MQSNLSRGQYNYTGVFTSVDGSGVGSGDPFADFLLGFPQQSTRTRGSGQGYLRQVVPAAYFQDVPVELEEAARVDGCSRAWAFWRVSLPLASPGVVSVGLLVAIAAWSEYFIPLILGSSATTPATVGIVNLIGVDTINWGAMAAGALTLIVPVFIATLLAQRNLVRGLTAGAIKG